MINVNELKNGVVIEYDNDLCQILEFQHVLQNKVAYVRVRMKKLRSGAIIETALKGSDQRFKRCYIDHQKMQFIYSTGEAYCFMNNETYEQIELPLSRLEWEKNFIVDGCEVEVVSYEGEILTVALPDKVTLTVTEADPTIKGASQTDRKKCTLETGLVVVVPSFVEAGDKLIVSTIDGSYVSRA